MEGAILAKVKAMTMKLPAVTVSAVVLTASWVGCSPSSTAPEDGDDVRVEDSDADSDSDSDSDSDDVDPDGGGDGDSGIKVDGTGGDSGIVNGECDQINFVSSRTPVSMLL